MDQYPFEFRLFVIGLDVEDFIKLLKDGGYESQAKAVQAQFDKEIRESLQPKGDGEVKYHLNCESCDATFWSEEGFPKPQLCQLCKSKKGN